MCSVEVVVVEEPLEIFVETGSTSVELTSEGYTVELMKHSAVKALDEPIGLGTSGFGLPVGNTRLSDCFCEDPLVLAPIIGKDCFYQYARFAIGGDEDANEKGSRFGSSIGRSESCESKRAGSIDCCELEDLTDSLEFSNIEGVKTDKLSGGSCLDWASTSPGSSHHEPSLGDDTSPGRSNLLEPYQTLIAGGKTGAAKDVVDTGGRDLPGTPLASGKLVCDPCWPVGGPDAYVGHDGGLHLSGSAIRHHRESFLLGTETVFTIGEVASLPLVEGSAGDAEANAGSHHSFFSCSSKQGSPHPKQHVIIGHGALLSSVRPGDPTVEECTIFRLKGRQEIPFHVSTLLEIRTV